MTFYERRATIYVFLARLEELCTTSGVVGGAGFSGASKMLKGLCDGQDAVR